MNSDRHHRLSELFGRLIELEGDPRAAELRRIGEEDPALRDELDALLAKHEDTDGGTYLDHPALGGDFRIEELATELGSDGTLVGRSIGHYTLQRVIATGGMGTVYEAVQEQPRRTVAVKLMRSGLASRSALRRFEYESQILARLRHPGIAQIFEAGTAEELEGRPFFVMEYIPGAKSLTEYARAHDLSTKARLALFARICDAVHHGHQKGIIHRDLKPANILVDGNGDPKVIDFGVARATDSDLAATTLQTDVGQLIGTIQYMSPEQCAADPHDLDTRSDVYALGVVLYELLSDRLPYDITRAAIHEAVRIVREEHPTRLSALDHTLSGDLETIALKAMEKERDRRYQSAIDLARDLRRYLDDQPIAARPPNVLYQFRKFARRHRAVVGSATAIAVVLVIAFIVTGLALAREAEQHRLADAEAAEAARQRSIAVAVNAFLQDDLLASLDPAELGHEVTMREALDVAAERIEGRFPDDPLIEASVRRTIGTTYQQLSALDEAEAQLVASLALIENAVGRDHAESRATRGALGELYQLATRLDEAEEILTPLLEETRRTEGPDSPITAMTATRLAWVLDDRGQFGEAETLYRDALRIREDVQGRDHLQTLRLLSDIGVCLRHDGRPDEARAYLLEAVEGFDRAFGPEHADTLNCWNNVGALYFGLRRYEEAVEVFERIVPIMERVYAEDDYRTLNAISSLATNLERTGRREQAIVHFEAVLPRLRKAVGEDGLYTLVAEHSLAGAYRRAGRPADAEPLFRHAADLLGTQLGPAQGYTLLAVAGLAAALVELDRVAEAELAYDEALSAATAAVGSTHPVVVSNHLTKIEICFGRTDRFELAETAIAEVDARVRAAGSIARRNEIAIFKAYVELYEKWGREAEMAEWQERLAAVEGDVE